MRQQATRAVLVFLVLIGIAPELVPGQKPPEKPPGGTIERRVAPARGERGTELLQGRFVLNDHGVHQGCQVFSVGVEIENLSAHGVNVRFDPKDLKVTVLDEAGKVVAESNLPRSGPAPIAHDAVVPTSGYIGFSTYRGGIGLVPQGYLLAAGRQDWSLKPGKYRLKGTVAVSAYFGGNVLDPEKPQRSAPRFPNKRLPPPLRVILILPETPLFEIPGK